ncbi:MAG TPA: DUF2672 domain-containing protein [Rickettsia endosymbiont of Pyrocoelia pectoralis]|nr:DUF2672 domain-containing protein [Rickettsia endosymbiont of Pyrocoelia pectoralis]
MSWTQLILTFLITILVIKPNEIFLIAKQVKKIKLYLYNLKSFIMKNNCLIKNKSDTKKINFYLQKIIALEGEYEGNYDLITIKEKYHKLIESTINDNKY